MHVQNYLKCLELWRMSRRWEMNRDCMQKLKKNNIATTNQQLIKSSWTFFIFGFDPVWWQQILSTRFEVDCKSPIQINSCDYECKHRLKEHACTYRLMANSRVVKLAKDNIIDIRSCESHTRRDKLSFIVYQPTHSQIHVHIGYINWQTECCRCCCRRRQVPASVIKMGHRHFAICVVANYCSS